ncbi:MAG: glycosyltransferase family 2 protein [Oryzomonas sp.]|uniref:glycosyltransferase family 2 protein n=1 Tax=Oryzomonas sp. TaxID=2855186 RepID=UPI0028407943|nr:glycosyltransferase family 2 protein [Oryzomonas sp.]MDR3580676.1 glycosyltransferase family 2 protein [Oryzomonas sp.]
MPDVSIIIPIYNTEQYLPHCLDSLIRQTLQDIEIICVDDVSTDRSAEIARSYAAEDPRVHLYSLPTNSRQGAARNLGLRMASAPYIGFVDSDDFVAPDYFENLYRAITRHDADIVMTPYAFVDQHGHEILPRGQKGFFRRRRRESLFERTLGRDWEDNRVVSAPLQRLKCVRQFMVMNKLYRSVLIKTVQFPENTRFEDVPFTMEAVHRAHKICTIPEGGYFYRRHPESTTADTDFRRFTESVTMLGMTDSYIAKSCMTTEEAEFCGKIVTETLRYTIRALIRSNSNLGLNQIIQAKSKVPPLFFRYFLWRLLRKHLKTAGIATLIVIVVYGVVLWLNR